MWRGLRLRGSLVRGRIQVRGGRTDDEVFDLFHESDVREELIVIVAVHCCDVGSC
jgi:hypothetical protein